MSLLGGYLHNFANMSPKFKKLNGFEQLFEIYQNPQSFLFNFFFFHCAELRSFSGYQCDGDGQALWPAKRPKVSAKKYNYHLSYPLLSVPSVRSVCHAVVAEKKKRKFKCLVHLFDGDSFEFVVLFVCRWRRERSNVKLFTHSFVFVFVYQVEQKKI